MAKKPAPRQKPAKRQKPAGGKSAPRKAPPKAKAAAPSSSTKKKPAKPGSAKPARSATSGTTAASTTKAASVKKDAASKAAAPATPKKQSAAKAAEKKPAAAKANRSKSAEPAAPTAAALAKAQRGRSVAEVASSSKVDSQGYVYINGRRIRMISAGGKAPTKRARAAAEAQAAAAEQEVATFKPVKTWLSKKQLEHYRELLLQKRAQIVGDLNALEDAALRSNGGDVSHMPIHMADVGTDTYDQDFALGMAESERLQLREIDEALQRIADRTYGTCMMTGEPIPQARLDAKPWAKYTIEAARKLEGQYGT